MNALNIRLNEDKLDCWSIVTGILSLRKDAIGEVPSAVQMSAAKRCFICDETTHLAMSCPKKKMRAKKIDDNQKKGDRKFAEIDFGSAKIEIQLDSGADVTIKNTDTWEKIATPDLQCHCQLQTAPQLRYLVVSKCNSAAKGSLAMVATSWLRTWTSFWALSGWTSCHLRRPSTPSAAKWFRNQLKRGSVKRVVRLIPRGLQGGTGTMLHEEGRIQN